MFNTRPSTIREINSWINKRRTNYEYQLKQTNPKDPMYQYLLERIEYCKTYTNKLDSMMGKKLPPNKRAKRMD